MNGPDAPGFPAPRPPGRSYASGQATKTTLFVAGNEADVRKSAAGDFSNSIDQMRAPLVSPGFLVGHGERIEVGGSCFRVVDPFTQQRAAVDHVEGKLAALVFVVEVTPDAVVGALAAQGF